MSEYLVDISNNNIILNELNQLNEHLIHINDLEGHNPETCRECRRSRESCSKSIYCISMSLSVAFILMLSYYDLRI